MSAAFRCNSLDNCVTVYLYLYVDVYLCMCVLGLVAFRTIEWVRGIEEM